ncbi:MAG TPA: hypothetical protein VFG04_16230 [Planctomycetaceae bacterium]|jgi:hypothetical protein|nr:hypothetical protein [Planctomycetaceae bacterium]
MRRAFAALLLVGLSVSIACADEKPAPPPSKATTIGSETHWRLAKRTDAHPQKIGILTYYPNDGGGYTFLEHGDIVFYALPYWPTTYQFNRNVVVFDIRNGIVVPRTIVEHVNVFTVGKFVMPFGGQTIYRAGTTEKQPGDRRREDVPIAEWSRDAPDGKFRLLILAEDRETRLKLKSIVPVLENDSIRLSNRP